MATTSGTTCTQCRPDGLNYFGFFADAEAREARGERQVRCPGCGRWRWPHLLVEPPLECPFCEAGEETQQESMNRRLRAEEVSPFALRAADALAAAVLRCVDNGALDPRSGPGDALLDYAEIRFGSIQEFRATLDATR